MKVQVKRFSPHQNAKVAAVLMALGSLVLVIPMFLVTLLFPMAPHNGPAGPSPFMILLFPVLYLVMGYIMVAIGCVLYNFVCKYTGGIEYEIGDQ